MIFVFLEDGTMDVVENLAEAQRAYEGVDVEGGVFVFYNDRGVYLEPRFTVPNRYGKFLWLFDWSSSGVYELVPNPGAPEDPIWLALFETHSLNPNRFFKTLDEVKACLKSNGAVVDRPVEK
ncbi:MAG: hypothetical protein ACAH83_03115 [Alphaproteobacteria bacterium]